MMENQAAVWIVTGLGSAAGTLALLLWKGLQSQLLELRRRIDKIDEELVYLRKIDVLEATAERLERSVESLEDRVRASEISQSKQGC